MNVYAIIGVRAFNDINQSWIFFKYNSPMIVLVLPQMYGYYVFFQNEIDLWVLNNSIVWFNSSYSSWSWHQWKSKGEFNSTYCHNTLPQLHSSIPTTYAYEVYILQLIRSARASSFHSFFLEGYLLVSIILF
jgi:hypothetical protein